MIVFGRVVDQDVAVGLLPIDASSVVRQRVPDEYAMAAAGVVEQADADIVAVEYDGPHEAPGRHDTESAAADGAIEQGRVPSHDAEHRSAGRNAVDEERSGATGEGVAVQVQRGAPDELDDAHPVALAPVRARGQDLGTGEITVEHVGSARAEDRSAVNRLCRHPSWDDQDYRESCNDQNRHQQYAPRSHASAPVVERVDSRPTLDID